MRLNNGRCILYSNYIISMIVNIIISLNVIVIV